MKKCLACEAIQHDPLSLQLMSVSGGIVAVVLCPVHYHQSLLLRYSAIDILTKLNDPDYSVPFTPAIFGVASGR